MRLFDLTDRERVEVATPLATSRRFAIVSAMSKTEILAGLKKLTRAELAEVQAGLDTLLGDEWIENGELTEADKTALDEALTEYRANPEAGDSWAAVEARIQTRIRT